MSNTVKGIVEYIGQKGKAWNIKMNNEWYGHGFTAPKFAKGDVISFEFAVNGNFKNIAIGSIEVEKAPPKPEQAPASVTHESKEEAKTYWSDKDRAITYGACQHDAVALAVSLVQVGALKLGSKPNAQVGVMVAAVQQIAKDLFNHAVNREYEKTNKEEVKQKALDEVQNNDE